MMVYYAANNNISDMKGNHLCVCYGLCRTFVIFKRSFVNVINDFPLFEEVTRNLPDMFVYDTEKIAKEE